MKKIVINNNKFNCPLLKKNITSEGLINYPICEHCKYNILGRILYNEVYCSYGSSSSGSSDPEIVEVLPESIEIDNTTYYQEQPQKPGDNYELKTIQINDTIYYGWVEIQEIPQVEVLPESIEIDNTTYYQEQSQKPGDNYELKTIQINDTIYYGWREIEEEVIPETIKADDITYYLEQPEKPGDNYKLKNIQINNVTYYTWVEIDEDDIDIDDFWEYYNNDENPNQNTDDEEQYDPWETYQN